MRAKMGRNILRLAVLGCLLLQLPAARPALAHERPGRAGPGVAGTEVMPAPAGGNAIPPALPAATPGRRPEAGATTLPNLSETAGWPSPVADDAFYSFTLFDLLEFQRAPNLEAARWDVVGWYGGDTQRLWYKSEGRHNGARRSGETDLQILYGRLISPFVDLQAGYRYERRWERNSGRGRSFAVLGVQGLVPYGAELEAALFVSEDGDVSARATVAQNVLLTQRLILLPRFEVNAALQRAERFGVGQGVNDIEIGVRLRYEIRREFAPYVGVSWLRSFGQTAALRGAEGEDRSLLQVVAGIRMWF
ncbi:copper resistance protein B [Roseicella aerolata]|uniref:Copper resistance protein B n=1 Tax=Roseicella aerolata TaxID=2883479 RepID=A0A9X1LA64_9PROT|nr:copper resistance protein B [Roseicella aerolata]MBY0331592.1 copper resistance protein B [Acetobacteraceae bacterium]MCB4824651.1 copper resistance protein B [Roseicella aerolata]